MLGAVSRAGRPSGFSLAETIIACFVLVAAMLVSSSLYNVALTHSSRIDKRYRAARVAERHLEEVRAWSLAQHGTGGELTFDQGWEAYNGVEAEDEFEKGYFVSVTATPQALFSPSSEFEKAFFGSMEDENVPADVSQRKVLGGSVYDIAVAVRWGDGPGDRLLSRTRLTDPCRDLGWDPDNPEHREDAIAFTYSTGASPPTNLAPGDSFWVEASVRDVEGAVVKNPVVQWYLSGTRTGAGTLITDPANPTRVTFRNEVVIKKIDPTAPGGDIHVQMPGAIEIVARVKMGRLELFRQTGTIQLGGS